MAFSLAVIIVLGLAADYLFRQIKLPGLVGMLIVGILAGPYVFNLLDPAMMAVSADFRKLALIVILLRAGFELRRDTLHRTARPALLLSAVPALLEIAGVIIIAPTLLDLTWMEAAILGSILGAVSPAVVVPLMINFMDRGKGDKKGILAVIRQLAEEEGIGKERAFELARLYASVGKLRESVKWFEKGVELGGWDNEVLTRILRLATAQQDYSALNPIFKLAANRPGMVHLLAILAQGKLHEGKVRDAVAIYEKLVEASKRKVPAFLLGLAQAKAALGQRKEADQLIAEILQTFPNDPISLLIHGNKPFDKGEYDKAAQFYEKAKEGDPASVDALLGLARIALVKGDLEKAKACSETLRELGYVGAPSLEIEGSIAILKGDMQTAYQKFREITRINPNYAFAQYWCGQCLLQQNSPGRAITAFTRCIESNPAFFLAYIGRAEAFIMRKEFDKALKDCEEALKRAPQSVDAKRVKAFALAAMGRQQEAFKILDELIQKGTLYPGIYGNYGELAQQLGLKEKAIAAFRKAIAEDSEDASSLNNLAWLLMEQGKLDEAEELARRAVDARADDPDIYDTYGWILAQKGDLERAEDYLRRARRLDHKQKWILYHLADVLSRRGMREEAQKFAEEALKLAPDFEEAKTLLKRLEQQ